jgi:hypothetical protein
MMASELISHLTTQMEKHGNCPIMIKTQTCEQRAKGQAIAMYPNSVKAFNMGGNNIELTIGFDYPVTVQTKI